MNRNVARIALVAAALLTMTAVAAPAQADLALGDPPVTVSIAGLYAVEPHVVVAGDGTIVATWHGDGGIHVARSVDAGATWQAPVTLSATGGGVSHIAVTGSGTIAVTWVGSGFTQVATSTDSGATWNPPVNISLAGQNPQDPWIFATSGSTFVVTWEGDSSVRASVSTDAGVTWSTASTVSTGGNFDASAPTVAANGTIFAVWTLNNVVQTSRSTDGGATWSVPANLSTGGNWNPRIAASPDGTITVTWQGGGAIINSVISTSRSTDGGATWSPPFVLSVDGLAANNARIAVAANGTIVVTWERGDGGAERIVQAATSTNGGATWSVPANLSAFGFYSDNPQIVVNGDGEFTVVWERDNLTALPPNAVVEVATLARAGATWTAPLQVSPETGVVREVQLAVAPNGEVTAVWEHETGTNTEVHSTTLRYSLAPAAAAAGLASGGFDVVSIGLAGTALLVLGAALVLRRRPTPAS